MQDKDKTGPKAEETDAKDGEATPPAEETSSNGKEAARESDAIRQAGGDTLAIEGEATSEPAEPTEPGDAEPLPEAERPPLDDEPAVAPARRSSPLVGMIGVVLLALMAAVLGSVVGPHILGTQDTDPPAGVEQRLAALEGDAAKFTDLSSRVAKLETEMGAASSGGDGTAELMDLGDRVAKLEAAGTATNTPGTPDISDLEAQVGKLETAVAGLSSSATTSSDGGTLATTVAGLKQQVDQTAKSLSDLQARLQNLDQLSSEVTSLASQVDELAGRSVDPKAAFVVAVGQLREAAAGGQPFEQELAAVEAVAPDDGAIAADLSSLKTLAIGGVPTLSDLQASFGATADAAVAAERAGKGWIDQTLSSLEGLVSVRRVGGDMAGDSAEAIVARAETALDGGDLETAVNDVAALSGAAADAAAEWLAQAKNRLAVDKAVASLGARASALVTGAAGGGS